MGIFKIFTSTCNQIEEFLNTLPEKSKDKMDVTTLLKNLINKNVKIKTLVIHGNWFEVGNKFDRDIYESHPEIQINFI